MNYNFWIVYFVFKVPGELNITYTLLGSEDRTLAQVVSQQGDELNLLDTSDILIFSNITFYNLSFTQLNDADVVEEYNVTAEVSLP